MNPTVPTSQSVAMEGLVTSLLRMGELNSVVVCSVSVLMTESERRLTEAENERD